MFPQAPFSPFSRHLFRRQHLGRIDLLLWQRSYRSNWRRCILHLLEHELNLSDFIVPTSTAQETEQGIVNRQGILHLTKCTMSFSRFLAELYQLVRFFNSQSIQVHAVHGFIKMYSCSAQVTTCSIALP